MSTILKVIIETKTPFNIGSGNQKDGFIKKYTNKGIDGRPYIPGSSIKGKIRDNLRYIIDSEEDLNELFGEGNNIRNSRVIVDNFYSEDNSDVNIEIRYGNAIDRYRRVAKDMALFNEEAVSGKFVGEIELLDEIAEMEIDNIILGIKMIESIGGSKSRGMGQVSITVEEVKK